MDVQVDGETVAALIGPEEFERSTEAVVERAWESIQRIKDRNADKDPDEIYRIVTEIVEEVRQEMYEERQLDGV